VAWVGARAKGLQERLLRGEELLLRRQPRQQHTRSPTAQAQGPGVGTCPPNYQQKGRRLSGRVKAAGGKFQGRFQARGKAASAHRVLVVLAVCLSAPATRVTSGLHVIIRTKSLRHPVISLKFTRSLMQPSRSSLDLATMSPLGSLSF
jgi:hypothetical protein